MANSEDDLWGMSDDELASAFREAQANSASPDTDIEDEILDPDTSDEEEGVEEFEEDSEEDTDEVAEQPEEDDSEDSADQEATTDEDEKDDETSEEEDTATTDKSDTETEVTSQVHKFKANGKDYEFTSAELVEQFPKIFGQAMDYTKKMQTIKPWRKTIDAIEGAKLSHEDINLMIDVMKGDKEAITEVLRRTGVDTLELDTEKDSQYVAKDYGRDDNTLTIEGIIGEISQDPEYSTTKSILSAGGWDDSSWKVISGNPEMIRLLHEDVKSGMYATLQPAAEKLKVYDGGKKSDLDYYKEAATSHFNKVAKQEAAERQRTVLEAEQERLAQVKVQTQKRNATKEASTKRKAAAPTKVAGSGTKVVDYLGDNDEAFDEWYKKLQEDM